MNLPISTVKRYERVTVLLHSIRFALFHWDLSEEDRSTLENYKHTLEPERVALRKAMETDPDFFSGFSNLLNRRAGLDS
ncbi:hypothetical protein LEP1GSC034_3870 [Leptospira interrogans str. 2003000735]|uniref:Uncharacterized protein n=2 Tax=Leptospira interrogans TaxID=173 RepID=A0A829D4R4_LEPIR|nr:hypothetical protein [Leptospira interrogans]EMY05327.1 hypothetical protein LEP1GSC029_3404 [Leptospira interrogans str. 2002000626]EMY24159.1 hypothetical protein LEP1GSC115_2911 [Leptospira interrogans serovar Australis str. 200703203]EKN89015.1 hypothetical protein LEP1GSC027_4219 [Leptospira interrogans str. 2002000624]EKQ36303.1 hypothetical protein LEP1GSC025_0748 [Leptospira interrogans str. 2002000621]EKQ47612.1 hypothetical protein LEP1GSC026_4656 [Leptospira interrogans str. 2002